MSLDFYLYDRVPVNVFDINITHNLAEMADKAGIYKALWRAEKNKYKNAKQLISPIKKAIKELESNPDKYKNYNPKNGWGSYETLLKSLKKILEACIKHPKAKIETWR